MILLILLKYIFYILYEIIINDFGVVWRRALNAKFKLDFERMDLGTIFGNSTLLK